MSLLGDIGKAAFGGNMMGLGTAAAIGGEVLAHEEREDQFDANLRWQQDQLRRNEELQREFAQHGVTWRVEDARRAGVHPLFALGGSGAAYSPSGIVSMGEDASVGDSIRRVGSSLKEWHQQQMMLESAAASVKKDEAQAAYFNALAAKARQDANNGKPAVPGLPEEVVHQGTPNVPSPGIGNYYDTRVTKANPVFSRDSNFSSVGAGSSPGFRAYEIFPGKLIDLPYSEEGPSESMENLTIVSWPFVIAHNIQHYGAEWLRDMWHIINPFVENANARSQK